MWVFGYSPSILNFLSWLLSLKSGVQVFGPGFWNLDPRFKVSSSTSYALVHSVIITQCDKDILQNVTESYYKVLQVLQSVTEIHYKVL